MSLIEIRAINRFFGTDSNRVQVLKNIDLRISKGDFVAIMGQSGSGKSTLMNILGCLDTPSSGSYCIDGEETTHMNADELASLRRKRFGFIFQRYNLLGSLNARDNVALPSVYAGLPQAARHKRACALLADLGLADKVNNKPSELSGGQQQRVSIARALMNGGEIILADEPTGALDSGSGENVMQIMHQLHRAGHTIIMVTHDAGIAAHANRVIEIRDGEIIADTSKTNDIVPSTVQSQPEQRSWTFFKDQFIESFKMSVQAIMAHKMRSLLTMLGIIIGIASVVSMVALGQGSQQKILADISSMGTNTINIFPGDGFGDRRSARVRSLTVSDVQALGQQNYVASVTPNTSTSGTMTYRNMNLAVQLYGAGEQYFDVRGIKLAQGRFFDADDVRHSRQVVVVDDNTWRKMTENHDAVLGQVIQFNKRPLTVIGVSQKDEGAFADADSLQMWAPYTTVMQQVTGDRNIRNITVKVRDDVNSQTAEKSLTELLIARHGQKDFFTVNSDSIKQTVENATATMTLLISSIALISLVVGGIGVMNIMLVSVTERTREIGIRMAIGARQSNILQQFLIEAILICIIGGLVGIGLSVGISALFNMLANDFAMSFSVASIVLAVLCSSIIGVVFGFMPAKNASKLDPIEALSRE